MRPHGTYSRYTNGKCRCRRCKHANAMYTAHHVPNRRCQPDCEWCIPPRFVLRNFPVALVARTAWPDDGDAIAAAFPNPA